ncbi:MAG: GAF domain-containing protein [Anaerolineae bacterium]|nr:GAF domain-containing protein [Anaerolineae bacterium]
MSDRAERVPEPGSVLVDRESLDALRAENRRLEQLLAQREQQLARAEGDLRRAVAESYALYLTSLDITSQLDLNSTLTSILRRAMLLTKAGGGVIFLLDSGSGELIVSAESNTQPGAFGMRVRSGQGVVGEVLLTGRSMALPDYSAWPERDSVYDGATVYAIAALPLRWQGRVIGVLSLHHTEPGPTFTLDDLDSLQHVTVQAAIAIHNARLFAEEKARNQQLASLYQAATRITNSLDLSVVLHMAAESLVEAAPVPGCAIYEYQGGDDGPKRLAAYRMNAAHRLELAERPDGLAALGPAWHVLQSGQWMVLQRDDPRPLPAVAAYMEREGVQSVLLAPILLGQRPIGLVELYDTRTVRRFDPAEIEMVQTMAAQIGVAIRHAELHHQLQAQRVAEQANQLKLTRRLLGTTERQQVAEFALDSIGEAFDVTCGLFLLRQAQDEPFRPVAALSWDVAGAKDAGLESATQSGVPYAVDHGEIVKVEDAFTETRFSVHPHILRQGLRSALIAPLRYTDETLGVLVLYRSAPSGFSDDDVKVLALLCYQVTVALERARLFESVQAYTEVLEDRIDDRIRQIRAEQERTEAIFQATGEALLVFDEDGVIQRVNRAFERKNRCMAHDAIGRLGVDVLGVDLIAKAPPPDLSGNAPSVWRGEMEMRRTDGTTYHAAATVSRVIDAAGHTQHIVASLRDISYLKELDEMKDRFISTISHELRTPLANMKLYTHLLDKGFDERRPQYLATLTRETTRLQQLIEDLLLLSRLENNTMPIHMSRLDLNELVGTLAADRTMLAASRDLRLSCTLHPDPLWALADEKMINQAVTNLLANAMNYTRPGGLIEVSTSLIETNRGLMATVAVRDNGLGIAKEDQARLFERFYRGSAAQATGAAGTGLGMAIVKEVIERHNGDIQFESTPGEGSTFWLHLPLLDPGVRAE